MEVSARGSGGALCHMRQQLLQGDKAGWVLLNTRCSAIAAVVGLADARRCSRIAHLLLHCMYCTPHILRHMLHTGATHCAHNAGTRAPGTHARAQPLAHTREARAHVSHAGMFIHGIRTSSCSLRWQNNIKGAYLQAATLAAGMSVRGGVARTAPALRTIQKQHPHHTQGGWQMAHLKNGQHNCFSAGHKGGQEGGVVVWDGRAGPRQSLRPRVTLRLRCQSGAARVGAARVALPEWAGCGSGCKRAWREACVGRGGGPAAGQLRRSAATGSRFRDPTLDPVCAIHGCGAGVIAPRPQLRVAAPSIQHWELG